MAAKKSSVSRWKVKEEIQEDDYLFAVDDQPLVEQTEANGCSEEEGDDDKGRSRVPELSPLVEQELAEFFEENPVFYDKGVADFKNVRKKDLLLEEKAAALNISASVMKLWYRSQRTILGKVIKKINAYPRRPLTARQKWVMTNLSFLKDHIVHRRIISRHAPLHNDEEEEEDDIAELSSSQPFTFTGQPSKRRRQDMDTTLLGYIQKSSGTESLLARVEQPPPPSQDEKRAWVDWMHQALQHLPRHLWREYTKESFEMVLKYQDLAAQEHATFNGSLEQMQ